MQNKYDVIIYKASLEGIKLAKKLTEQGKKVLLINNIGFCGDTITETLNLLQYKNNILSFQFEKLPEFLYDDGNKVIVEPETFKFYLHKFLVDNSIEHLFYVTVLQFKDNEVELIAKEGNLKFYFDVFVDASEQFDIYKYFNSNYTFEKAYIHLITNKPLEIEIVNNIENIKYLQLQDKRYFITLQNDEKDLIKLDNRMVEILMNFDETIYPVRSQLVPGNTHKIYKKPNTKIITKNIVFPEYFEEL
ncbi:MAG TPA: hypothetical protein PLP99_00875 [Ignavibacteriales bacterium]|nr:hypothetical protein [Ignavibacteriales bacterium]